MTFRRPIESRSFAACLFIVSVVSYVLGMIYPVFTTTRFYLFKNEVTLLKSIETFFREGDVSLGIVILVFTLVTPVLKYIVTAVIIFSHEISRSHRIFNMLKTIGRWSMLDVFVIAIVVLVIRMKGGMFMVTIQSGTLYFALSVITSMATIYVLPVQSTVSESISQE